MKLTNHYSKQEHLSLRQVSNLTNKYLYEDTRQKQTLLAYYTCRKLQT